MIKKITLLLLFVVAFSWQGNAQSTINITTSGGIYATEKWVNITTEVDGAGTQVWGQGDGSYGNGAGLINVDIDIAPGTYYVNCYDKYADGWDGTLISITAYGAVLNDNGGATPNDGTNDDASSSFGDTQAQELEASLQIVVPAAPSCTPPTGLAVDSMTSPSNAAISWSAVTGATGYNYEIQPQGTAQGTAGAIASGSGTNTSFNVTTGLVTGTSYTIYVQTDCGNGDSSTYASLDFIFAPEPDNDECSGAISLTVNTDLNCGTVQAGSIFGATASGVDEGACGGTENDDVWFSFVASTTSHQIKLTNISGSPIDLYHSVWEGSCGSLTLVSGSCSDSNTSVPSGLTAGNTYYVRVNSYSSNNGAATTFDICIGTFPPPPANDIPTGAIALTLDEGTTCGANAMTGISNDYTTDSGVTTPDCGSYSASTGNGDLWYTFVAPASGAATLNTSNVTGMTSVAGAYYSGTPGSLVELDCTQFSSGWPWDLTGLTAGDTYYLRVWDYSNDENGTFDLCGYYQAYANPSFTLAANRDCANSQFTVDVNVTGLGGSSAITVTDDQSSPSQNATSTGILTFGPYTEGTTVSFTATSDDNNTYTFTDSITENTCPPAAVTPDYTNDFSTYPGTDWRESEGAFSSPNFSDTSSSWIQDDYLNDTAHANGKAARINIYGTNTNEYLITVPFDLTASTYYLNYDIGLTDYSTTGTDSMSSDDYLSLLVSQDYGDTWTELKRWTAADNLSNTGESAPEIVLTGYGAVTMFAFYAFSDTANNDYNIYIDNFSITSSSLGIENTTISGFAYYPNPVNDQLSLRANNNIDNVILRNILGQTVLTVAPSATSTAIDMSQLKQGTYFVSVQVGDAIQTVKVMKN